MQIFGLDIGGSGIKGAPVDLDSGELVFERFKLLTPHPAEPQAVADRVVEVVRHFGWTGAVGATYPGVVTAGITRSAANMHKSWIGLETHALLAAKLGLPVTVVNDADAAGIAEMEFGAGKGRAGTVIMLTFGTGIGSAVFIDGALVPNTELGHLELDGHDAETRAASRVKVEEGLTWKHWTHRVQRYLAYVEMLFSPDLFIIGGGVSREADDFIPRIEGIRAEIVPAALRNNAGIVGAAMVAKTVCQPQEQAQSQPQPQPQEQPQTQPQPQ
jgi:polyphosphate glucokinase